MIVYSFSYPFHCIMSYFLIMIKNNTFKLMGILMYNSLIILAKQFMHTCRFMKVRPLCFGFYKEVNFV